MAETKEDYSRFKIKSYDFWDLYLHMNQFPYLGRCYAAVKREDAPDHHKMFPIERDELFDDVEKQWFKAANELYGVKLSNLDFLANTWRHLHAHFIPRYDGSEFEKYGIMFQDPNPKGNYSPYEKRKIPEEILMQIKDDIRNHI